MAAVIVGYRRYDLLAQTLASLTRSVARVSEVIVVDNDSDADQLGSLIVAFPHVRFVANDKNVGFAAGANQGFRLASAEYVLFLNPDVELEPGTLGAAVAELTRDDTIGVVTCRLNLPDGTLDHACRRGIPTPAASIAYALKLHRIAPNSRWAGRYTMSWLDATADHDVEACSGAFMLMRASTFRAAGGWDEAYRFYAEDLDLCMRVREMGLRVRYIGHASAVHRKSATSYVRVQGELTPRQHAVRARVKREIVESHRLFFKKNLAASEGVWIRSLIYLWFDLQSLWVRMRYRT